MKVCQIIRLVPVCLFDYITVSVSACLFYFGFLLPALKDDIDNRRTILFNDVPSSLLNLTVQCIHNNMFSMCKCQHVHFPFSFFPPSLSALPLNCECVSGTVFRDQCWRLMSVCSEYRSGETSFCHNYREPL